MTPLEQAFEAAYLRDKDPNSTIVKDALVRGANGQYFHQHMRSYLKFFEAGFGYGMATATEAMLEVAEPDPCAGGHIPIGWTGTVHCEVCNKKLGDEPRIDPEKEKAAQRVAENAGLVALPERNKDHECDGAGPRTAWGTTTCSKCGFDWDLPF